MHLTFRRQLNPTKRKIHLIILLWTCGASVLYPGPQNTAAIGRRVQQAGLHGLVLVAGEVQRRELAAVCDVHARVGLEEELRELQASVVRREVERTEPSAPVLLPDDILQQILLRVLLGTYFVYELHLLSFREIGVTF